MSGMTTLAEPGVKFVGAINHEPLFASFVLRH